MYQSHQVLGRLVRAVEVKATPSGKHVADFTLAVDGYGKDVPADFVDFQVWDKTADYLAKYTTKGSLVFAVGTVKKNNYKNKDGQQIYRTYTLVNTVKIISGKSDTPQSEETTEEDPFAPQTSTDTSDPFGDVTTSTNLVNDDSVPF